MKNIASKEPELVRALSKYNNSKAYETLVRLGEVAQLKLKATAIKVFEDY